MKTRRQFLKTAALAGGGLLLPWKGLVWEARAAIPGGTLNPADIPKYQWPLFVLPAMPQSALTLSGRPTNFDYYDIAARQFLQQMLPPFLPPTPVWGYGSVTFPGTFHTPSFVIQATVNRPTRVKWRIQLVDLFGHYLPHLLPVDQTLHWANPPGPRDQTPNFSRSGTPGPYRGPVPTVVHLHGAHVGPESDGYPDAWFLPNAVNLPPPYFKKGSQYNQYDHTNNDPGTAVYQYPNTQRDTMLWFHDHALGMTRVNVYAGLVGAYMIRGQEEAQLAHALPGPGLLPLLGRPYEIPLVIQDRSFNRDGSLFYPDSRVFFDGFTGPYIPDSDVPPIWNSEFFGNTMCVNGNTWPFLIVEPRRYRFRLLNACNSRFLILKFDHPNLVFWQIGSEGSFLPGPVPLEQLLLAKAERADVIVDFSGLPIGTQIILQNIGPDEPFGGGIPGVDFLSADPASTGQVMKFIVGVPLSIDQSVPPNQLSLPPRTVLAAATNTRLVSLNELDSAVLPGVGPTMSLLGTVNPDGTGKPLHWDDPITENPALGSTEIWEIHNFTEDAHPIHVHQVQFQVVDRQPFNGAVRQPEVWESGAKDTVVTYPGEITRIQAHFDIGGLYIWHCHILEHEDNEMMRPFMVK